MSIGLLRKIHQDLSIKDNNSGQFYFFILIFYKYIEVVHFF